MSLHIAYNTLFLVPNEVGGTEYYTRSLLASLEKVKPLPSVLFCNRENAQTFSLTSAAWRKVICGVSAKWRWQRLLYEQLVLPWKVWRADAHVIHSFGYIGPFLAPARKVITVHDANWRDFPEDQGFLARAVTRALMAASLYSADFIVTDSAFSLSRLQHFYPQYGRKMRVIEPGLDEQFLQLLQEPQSLPTFVKKPFFLCVSAMYPHKNVSYLLELWPELKKSHPDASLIIVGKNGRLAKEIYAQSEKIQGIIVLPKVSLTHLVSLYQNCLSFFFPSSYEGFGFPVYEALAAGSTVFVGEKTCYRESAQKEVFAFSFDPQKDARAVSEKSQRRQPKILTQSYDQSARKLLDLYSE